MNASLFHRTGEKEGVLASKINSITNRICPLFFGSESPGLRIFRDLSTGEHCPLRIPVLRKRRPEDLAAVSPIDKSRKYEALPPVTRNKGHIL
jgi:hypothetical protein